MVPRIFTKYEIKEFQDSDLVRKMPVFWVKLKRWELGTVRTNTSNFIGMYYGLFHLLIRKIYMLIKAL